MNVLRNEKTGKVEVQVENISIVEGDGQELKMEREIDEMPCFYLMLGIISCLARK